MASAVQFSFNSDATITFVSGTGTFSVFDTPSISLNVNAGGNGSASASAGAFGTGPYQFVSDGSGSVTNGFATSVSNATHQFLLQNTGAGTATFQIVLDYTLSANWTGRNASDIAIANAGISSVGSLLSLLDQIGVDSTIDPGTSSAVSGPHHLVFNRSLLPGQQAGFVVSTSGDGYVSATPVPEPASMAAMGIGLAGILARRRRKAASK